MPWWTWITLAGFAAVVVGGSAVLLVLGLRAWRGFRASQRALTGALEELAKVAEELERRVTAVSERSAEIEQRLAALNRSLERLAVLRWALGDAADLVARVRESVPRK